MSYATKSTSSRGVDLAPEPGARLRNLRVQLRLRYRDVEEASQRIANVYANDEFVVGLSRLADIEHKGTVPSVYRLYSLCAIYGIDISTVLEWYGIELGRLGFDTAQLSLEQTRPVNLKFPGKTLVDFPSEMDPALDLKKTSYLSRHIRRWGKLPLAVFGALDLRRYRYGFIGTEDWSMHPILAPGSFVQIDENRRKIQAGGWQSEYTRPIYFLELRDGYRCGWCAVRKGMLVLQTHSAFEAGPDVFRFPGEVEVVGQVIAVAMRLDLGRVRRKHS